MINIKRVNTEEEFKIAYYLRVEVFVVEQGVPMELEKDEYDACAIHVLAFDDKEAIGCGRLVKFDQEGKIGRVAVKKQMRKKGVGRLICNELIKLAKDLDLKSVVLDAQTYAIDFYLKLGFEVESEMFLEAGIEHIKMRKNL
ncbi:MAG: GNAT family N-acetyltransferase [Bacillota bacterium]